jgi:hydroxymethylpyrimidine pyrophosphatase-like HAD family hydrolase
MKPIAEITAAEATGIRYVLMDIDDTLTSGGKLSAEAFTALWRLHKAGLVVIPVTGRPAGWCDLIAREWPVDGVVGENGALVFWEIPAGVEAGEQPAAGTVTPAGTLKQEFHPHAVRNNHPALQRVKERALAEVPGLRIARDQFARLFDMALDFAEEAPVLPLEAAERVRAIALEEGAHAKISSIHVNVWMGNYDKLSMAEWFLQNCFGWNPHNSNCGCSGNSNCGDDRSVLFVGDSPNDEPMFARFPLACGVANIKRYGGLIQHLPAFVSEKECGEGFAEIAEALLRKR